MKKIFTILCAVLITIGLSAQTESGSILLEGGSNIDYSSVSINSIEVDGESMDLDDVDATNTLGLKVTGAYFMMDGLAVGLLLDYSSTSEGDHSESSMLVGPMARYYIGESGMFAQLSYGIGSSSQKHDGDSEDGPSVSSLGLGAGYAVMLSDNISLNPSLGYSMVTSKMDDVVVKGGGLSFDVGIAVHLGN